MNKAKIIEDILKKYKKQGKVTFLMNDMTYHAEEDLDLEILCNELADKIESSLLDTKDKKE